MPRVLMRAPTGETAEVEPHEVDIFRKRGAVVIQPDSDTRSTLTRGWARANEPLVDLPRVDEDDMMTVGRDLSERPGFVSSMKALRALGQRGVNVASDFAEGMTSPVGLATMALSGGASLAGRAGYAGIGAAARAGEAALSAPFIAEGAHNLATAESPGQAMAGAVQAGLGGLGVRSALSTRGFTPVRYGKDALFEAEAKANVAGASLTQTAPEQLFQRRSGDRVYYGLNETPTGRDLTSVMNNQPGYRGAVTQVLPDAAARGANTLDAWAVKSPKFPQGMLPTLYGREGWKIVKRESYDVAAYGEPDEALKASWRTQGWRDGDPIPDVVYMARPGTGGRPGKSGDTSVAPVGATDSAGAPVPPTPAGAVPSPRQSTRPATALSIAAPAASGLVPDDPESEWDDYARLGLGLGGLAALGAAAKTRVAPKATAPQLSHLERAPVDIDDAGRMFVSGRVPTTKRGQVKADAPLNVGMQEVLQDPALVGKFAEKIRGYNILTDAQAKGTDEQVLRHFLETGTENIRYMIGQMEKGGWAPFSREWYDGANTVTGNMAREFKVKPNAVTGVVAVLSPQKDWHQNAEMAKRLIRNHREFWRTNPAFDKETFAHFRTTNTRALTDSLKQGVRDKKITRETMHWVLQEHPYVLDQYERAVVGHRWQDLAHSDQAAFLRAYDERVNGQRYPVLAPSGAVAHEFALTDSGSPAKMAWQSYAQLEKALAILDNPTPEHISQMLGDEHKVRAFFNNMSRPDWGRQAGQRGPGTVDTHQVAVSHLMPYGAKASEVKYTMGGAGNATLGLSGLNPIYQEMLTDAVKGNPNNYLPRAGQSVSWDGVKSLFSPEQKRDAKFVDRMKGLWREYQQGRMSLRGVQDAVITEAGGIKPPEWAAR